MTQKSISQYGNIADSVSLAKLAGQRFTIVKVEDSNYENEGTTTKGVKITTEESFSIAGKERNKFHSTRTAVVSKLSNENLRADLMKGEKIGPMKCVLVPSKKGGKEYFDLVDD